MKFIKILILFSVLILFSSVVYGAPVDQNFRLWIDPDSESAYTGEQVIFDIMLDTSSYSIRGWETSVCHDSSKLDLVSVVSGSAVSSINPLYEDLQIDGSGDGFTHIVVGLNPIGPGTSYHLSTAVYDVVGSGPDSTSIWFCDGMFQPGPYPIVNRVMRIGGGEYYPDPQEGATIDILQLPPPELYVEGPVNVQVMENDQIVIPMEIRLNNPGYEIQAWSWGMCAIDYPQGTLLLGPPTQGPVVAGLNSNSGPDLEQIDTYGIDWTVGAVADEYGSETISTGDYLMYTADYRIDGFQLESGAYQLEICPCGGALGSPPFANVFTVDGESVYPNENCWVVGIDVIEGEQNEFIRGDANEDGRIDAADAVRIVDAIERGGSSFSCDDAADAQDDGDINIDDAEYILNYRFFSGAEPSNPFPGCGLDPSNGEDGLGCDSYPHCGVGP